ncbi:hypothetical protein L6164_036099 [Bauhinia variegata]|uniref:Uncharacterized protein n=1 Tax=Bauhinia variegata TaxID=167791 RepID=A0ACB9KFZ5_BAUVA|nr:hypothetical protein L6164_036099 [Bauhinia variegata]
MAEELNNSLEYTPTWIVAVVCSIIVAASFMAERGLHQLGKYLKGKDQTALYEALQKLEEELMLLGFISLLLTVSQNIISQICISRELATHMLPCKRPSGSSKGSEHHLIYLDTIINRRRLLSEGSNSQHCARKGKVPLLSLESLHHLHIFIFVLAVVHVVFCVTTMLLGGARIRQWKHWENKIARSRGIQGSLYREEFFKQYAHGYWRRAAVVGWLIAFFKQFFSAVTESDYVAMRHGFVKEHFPTRPQFDFHEYMMRTLEFDFKKVVGISWYLWLFVVIFLLLNLDGWHTYFWLAFLPLILLLLVGAKLEHIIARLAQESGKMMAEEQVGAPVRGSKSQETTRVKPSDEYFWFNRPSLVLNLIHFILFQNSFEIAFFFWILCTYGFDSCIMEKIYYIIPRLVMGVIVQVLCSYSTLPLYTIVTQMGSKFKHGILKSPTESALKDWVSETKNDSEDSPRRTMTMRMVKDTTEYVQTAEQAVITVEETAASAIELPCIVQVTQEGSKL